MIKIMYEGKMIGEVVTNRNMTKEEVIEYGLGLTTITDQVELRKLYENGEGYVYTENDMYFLDIENVEVV